MCCHIHCVCDWVHWVPPVKTVKNDYLILLTDNIITEPCWGRWRNIWRMVQVHRQIPSARASAHCTRCSTNSIHLLHLSVVLLHAPVFSIPLSSFSTFLLSQRKCLSTCLSAYREVSQQSFFYWVLSKICGQSQVLMTTDRSANVTTRNCAML